MHWLRVLRQTSSFALGYGRGLEARPFAVPWWVDRLVYSCAYAEGAKERQQRVSMPEGPDPAPGDR